jgi:hypothetical protein
MMTALILWQKSSLQLKLERFDWQSTDKAGWGRMSAHPANWNEKEVKKKDRTEGNGQDIRIFVGHAMCCFSLPLEDMSSDF